MRVGHEAAEPGLCLLFSNFPLYLFSSEVARKVMMIRGIVSYFDKPPKPI